MNKKIYFVRHGESTDNVNGIVGGAESDSELTNVGIQQAIDTARNLSGVDFDLIVSSPLVRALDTTRYILETNNLSRRISVKQEFIEKYVGEFAGQPYPIYKTFKLGGGASGESEAEMIERVQRGLEWLKRQQFKNALVVSHSATIANIRAIVENIPLDQLATIPRLKNAEVYVLVADEIPDLK